MQTLQLPKIEIGRPFVGAISWDESTATGAENLQSGTRVVGQFREEPGCPVLATVDTGLGTLAITEARTLELRMTAVQTKAFAGRDFAWIDFLRFDDPEHPIGIPFAIKWPITTPITVL
jgi:hypothetical protein